MRHVQAMAGDLESDAGTGTFVLSPIQVRYLGTLECNPGFPCSLLSKMDGGTWIRPEQTYWQITEWILSPSPLSRRPDPMKSQIFSGRCAPPAMGSRTCLSTPQFIKGDIALLLGNTPAGPMTRRFRIHFIPPPGRDRWASRLSRAGPNPPEMKTVR